MEFNFEDFKNRAKNPTLSKWEKIGFPDSYRENNEKIIFEDIKYKLHLEESKTILDIGCGCSNLVEYLIEFSSKNSSRLVLIDSKEMLNNIDSKLINDNIQILPGYFPEQKVLEQINSNFFDAIIIYSVIQYVFLEQNIFSFIHHCIDLLKPGGRLLIGDIPNFCSRERFLNSDAGKAFISNKTSVDNSVGIKHENAERIDDAVIMAILQRFRKFGCETYLLPQTNGLPFANRREDILIIKR